MIVTTDAAGLRVLDYALDSLIWVRRNLDDQRAALKLRELDIALAAVALAVDQQMEGDGSGAGEAMRHADWSQRGTAYDCW
jgi:hypothetical protein